MGWSSELQRIPFGELLVKLAGRIHHPTQRILQRVHGVLPVSQVGRGEFTPEQTALVERKFRNSLNQAKQEARRLRLLGENISEEYRRAGETPPHTIYGSYGPSGHKAVFGTKGQQVHLRTVYDPNMEPARGAQEINEQLVTRLRSKARRK
jgi:hypothetical protein